MNESGGSQSFDIRLTNQQLRRDAQAAMAQFDRITQKAVSGGMQIDNALLKVGKTIGTVFAANQIGHFAAQVISLRSEMQSLEISFQTLAGKSKGNALFKDIRDFATSTPMMMKDLAQGAQTMLAFNIEAEKVMPMLKAIGDISMGDAQKFNSLSLAYSQMSATGKLMGQDLLQMINAGFNPLAVISEKTGKTIGELKEQMESGKITVDMVTDAFISATSAGGKFYGMLEAQAQGLAGAQAKLSGAINDMMNEIGESTQGAVVSVLNVGIKLAQNYQQVGRILSGLIATYGVYRAALIAVTACKGWATAAEALHYNWLLLVEKAQKMLNATMFANPYVLVATLIAGVVASMISMKTEAERLREKEEEYEQQKQKTIEAEQKHRDEIEKLCSVAEDEALSTDVRREALQKLEQKYPDIFAKYKTETEMLENIMGIKQKIAELEGEGSITNPTNELAAVENRLGEIEKESYELIARKEAYNRWLENGKEGKSSDYLEDVYNDMREGKINISSRADNYSEYQMLQNRRRELKSTIHTQEADKYFANLTGISDEELARQIQVRRDLLAKMEMSGATSGQINGDIPLVGDYSKEELKAQLQQLDRQQKYRDADTKSGAEWVAAKKEAYDKALKAYNDYVNGITSKGVKEEDFKKKSEELKAEMEDTKKAYEKIKPATDSDNKKAADKENRHNVEIAARKREIEEQKKTEERANRDSMLEIEQERINLLSDSTEKTLTQIELDKKRMEYAIEDRETALLKKYRDIREREWKNANPEAKEKGMSFDYSAITVDSMREDSKQKGNEWLAESFAAIDASREIMKAKTLKATEDVNAVERQAYDEYLRDYGDYIQKRQAMIDIANRNMSAAGTEGERLSIAAQLEKDLAALDQEANQKTSAVAQLFGDMTDKTIADLRRIEAQGRKALDFLTKGEWNAETGAELGMSEETFNTLRKSPEELEKIRRAIAAIKREADGAEGGFKKFAAGLKEIFKAGNDPKKFQEALGKISEGMQTVNQVAGLLQSSLGQLGEAFGNDTLGDIANGIGIAMDAMDSAMQGAQAGAAFGPWGAAAGAAIGLVSSLGSAIAKLHDAKHEKKIQELQDQVEVLERAYDKLDKAISKAYSGKAKELIEQQNVLLRQKQTLIRQQIAEEEAKKKTDQDKIKEWKKQLEEIEDQIADNKEAAIDAIFGEEISAAIDRFADAYESMFDGGITRARASKDLVKQMIKNMIIEAMKADISSPMEKLREMLMGFWSDEKITDWEQNRLNGYVEELLAQQENKWGWADGYFKGSSTQSSSKGGFSTMSQDSADELNGRFTALQMAGETIKTATLEINEQLRAVAARSAVMASAVDEIRGLSLIAVDHLEAIRKHTANLQEMNERLGKIEKYTSRI